MPWLFDDGRRWGCKTGHGKGNNRNRNGDRCAWLCCCHCKQRQSPAKIPFLRSSANCFASANGFRSCSNSAPKGYISHHKHRINSPGACAHGVSEPRPHSSVPVPSPCVLFLRTWIPLGIQLYWGVPIGQAKSGGPSGDPRGTLGGPRVDAGKPSKSLVFLTISMPC